MRYAIWAAVSSERQATPDKISLEHQIDACRARAAQYGWRETSGPYIVPGESRTTWINLRDAETALPPLRALLDAAQRGEFDLLLLYDFTRLRELIDPVTRALAAYGIQTYSLAQSLPPVDPAQFDKRISGTASVVQAFAMLTSRAEIENLTRRMQMGRLGRLPKGLRASGRLPYGYKTDPLTGQTVLDPPAAAIVTQIKDLYLAGQTVPQIIEHLRQQGIPPRRGSLPTWSDYSIRYILRNPFYAGTIRFGLTRITHDPRRGSRTQRLADPAQIEHHPGSHPPLWDEITQYQIMKEMQRRAKRHKGPRTKTLSGLLYCAQHHRPLYSKQQNEKFYWYCPIASPAHHWHCSLTNAQALAWLAERLTTDLQTIQNGLSLPDPAATAPLLQDALSDLLTRRERLTDALETGALDPATYATRTAAINARLDEIRAQLSTQANAETTRLHRLQSAHNLLDIIDQIPDFITHADPQTVNTALHALIKKIIVSPGQELTIEYW